MKIFVKINLKWLPFLKGIIDLCAILVYQIFKKGNIIMKVSEPINVISWLEKQINYTMQEIEKDRDDDSLLSILDKYISMKKKIWGIYRSSSWDNTCYAGLCYFYSRATPWQKQHSKRDGSQIFTF